MGRIYIRKTTKASSYSKDNLQNAIESVKSDGRLSTKNASVLYKIPRTTLRDHITGRRGTKSQSMGRGTDLPIELEKKMAEAIITLEKWGYGLSRGEVLEKIGEFFRKNELKTRFKDGIPGPDWFIQFRKRHGLSIKKPQSVEVARKKLFKPL